MAVRSFLSCRCDHQSVQARSATRFISFLSVTFDGATLDPTQEMLFDTSLTVPLEDNSAESFTVRIIEWRTGKHRVLYFGKDHQHFFHQASGSELEGLLPYSAYITLGQVSMTMRFRCSASVTWRKTSRAVSSDPQRSLFARTSSRGAGLSGATKFNSGSRRAYTRTRERREPGPRKRSVRSSTLCRAPSFLRFTRARLAPM